jgi:dihydrofolate synthase/folylpolyglutamate synthase
VHGPLPDEALEVFVSRAAALGLDLEEVRAHEVEVGPEGVTFSTASRRRIAASVFGHHQATNAAISIRAAERCLARPLRAEELKGLQQLSLPARVEPIGSAVLDSAHTPGSVRALRETLELLYPGRSFVTILSISKDKDAVGILREIVPITRHLVLCRAELQRSRDPETLQHEARSCGLEQVEVVPEPAKALERARRELQPGELLAVTGSFYLAGALRPRLQALAGGP